MRTKLFLPVVAICCAFALFAGACSSTEDSKNKDAEATTTVKAEKETTTTTAAPTETLAALLVADPQLSEFSGLATEAGLNAMLTDGGPFTVLAPTNAAIDTVPAATMTALEQDPKGALANVLKLHILNGNVTWDDLSEKNGQCVATLGGNVKVTVEGEGDDAAVDFGGAPVPAQDGIKAVNGTILKVDGVTTAPATDC